MRRRDRKIERHKKAAKGRLKPGKKQDKKSWQMRNAARKDKQESFAAELKRTTDALGAIEAGEGITLDSGPADPMDFSMEPGPPELG